MRRPLATTLPDRSLEGRLQCRFGGAPVGIDEAGRGPLAGPVVAAGVRFYGKEMPEGICDSKLLSAERRSAYFKIIVTLADICVATSSVGAIDSTNIRLATLDAMRRSVLGFSPCPIVALIDGRDIPIRINIPAVAVVGGDRSCLSIAAASIVAKCVRDAIMDRLHQKYPQYGFDRNRGYATKSHREALMRFGACRAHRRTFLKSFAETVATPDASAWPFDRVSDLNTCF